jgi:hypothetical protein
LGQLPLPDILLHLLMGGATGVLSLVSGGAKKALYVKNGRVLFASSNLRQRPVASDSATSAPHGAFVWMVELKSQRILQLRQDTKRQHPGGCEGDRCCDNRPLQPP